MTVTKVLGTYALIAFFEDEPGSDFVRSLLLEAESGSLNLAMCVVNLGELWYIIARADSPAQADALVEEVQGFSIEIVDSDCNTAALGQLRKAEVITGDPEFQKLREEITLSWVESPRTK